MNKCILRLYKSGQMRKWICLVVLSSFFTSFLVAQKEDSKKSEEIHDDLSKPVAELVSLDSVRVNQLLKIVADQPRGLGEPASNRAAWNKIAAQMKYDAFIAKVNKLDIANFPKWDEDLYLEYQKKGVRKNADKMIGERTKWLPQLVFAECLEYKGNYLPSIEFVVKELIQQKSWTLPAHDKGNKNFEGKEYDVDLNAAKMATFLSQTLYLLGEKLSAKTQNDIKNDLRSRIFDPVLQTYKTKKNHWWLTTTNNWNAVCLSGVTGAAFAVLPGKYERAVFAAIAERYSRNYLAGYSDDGYCTEGLGYYNYGFGNFITLREFLLVGSDNKLDLFQDSKMKNIALYPINLEIINQVWPSISDCRAGSKPNENILWYCNKSVGLGIKKYNETNINNPDDLVFDAIKLFPDNIKSINSGNNVKDGYQIRSYFEKTGVLICRPKDASKTGAMGVAIKGGTNNEAHNHNAMGSYSIVVGNEMLMGDPGGPLFYNSKTFTSERYTLFKSLASFGHPVPLVAGVQQRPGEEAKTKVLKTDFSKDKDVLVMDISSAYLVPTLKKLERKFIYDRTQTGDLEVTDIFAFSSPQLFETALTTRAKWKQINETQLLLEGEKGKLLVTIQAPCPIKIISEDIEESQPVFTRIGIQLEKPLASGEVKLVYSTK